jgi:TonB family protein
VDTPAAVVHPRHSRKALTFWGEHLKFFGLQHARVCQFAAASFVCFALAPVPANAQPAQSASPVASLEPPHALTEPTVPYPEGAVGEATVVLTVTVNVDGTVRSAASAQPNEPFSTTAVQAALAWHYEPAKRSGKPVASRIRVEVRFRPPATPTSTPSPTNTPGAAPSPIAPPADVVEEVTVRGAHEEPSVTASLSRAEVRQLPGAFGDPFRAIEIMPGVTPIISGLPYFYIRGAPPGDAGYFLDGVRVPYLFHVALGPSIVHPALIDRVDLYPGGYPVRFGRFAGGIVSGETVQPQDELHGEYNVRIFDAGAIAEAPFDGGKGTVLLGGRYSYTGLILSLASPSTQLSYWDYQARATYDVTPRDRVGVFAFGADDFLGQKESGTTQTIFGAQFHRIDLRYDHRLDEKGTMRTAITIGEDLTEVGNGQSVRDRLVGARTELAYRLSPQALLRAGLDAQVDSYDVVFNPSMLGPSESSLAANYFPSRSDLATGIRGDIVLDVVRGLEFTPGLRLDFYGSDGATAVAIDPRLSARATMSERTHLLWAMGVAHQPPAFVVPIPGIQPGGLKGGLQTAAQESLGVEWDVGSATTATATVFHNGFFNFSDPLGVMQAQPEGNPPPMSPTAGPNVGAGGQTTMDSGTSQTVQSFEQRTNGTAYGLELFIKRKLTERFGGIVSYTLSRSTRVYEGQSFLSAFDRTHVFSSAAMYDLGRNWRAGARVTYYTGLPKPAVPSSPSTRLPSFFRLDLRLEKRWPLGRTMWISFVAEWLNATLSKEAVPTSCTPQDCQSTTIGPVTIPSIGMEGGF